ncbi:MAG: DNA mismatch repair endonuclease MutL, partial [Spirochaetales bacterium]|nr:DNA mismatch repair endonuclease MutL [Spirochaetales bacterium]
IDVHLESGGNDLIRVTDDGSGMTRENLERCYLPHATSKITTDDDLLRLRTLGFRGEALSSMAAVSRLTVTSMRLLPGVDAPQPPAAVPHRIQVHGGKLIEVAPAAGSPGTSVEVANLFFNVPARKRFLKRAQSESALVRATLVDKALAFPDVTFRLFSGNDLKLFLPAGGRTDRITAAYPERTEPALLHSLAGSGDGFTFEIIAGEPTAPRKDRKQVQIFVNRRRIWEFGLVQAIEYGYRDYLHGGLFPVAYLFLEVEPDLVDFNIHPAKREARFRNLPEIHRRVVETLGSYLRTFDRASMRSPFGSDTPRLPDFGSAASGAGVADSPWKPAPSDRGSFAAGGRPPGASYDLSRSLELPDETGTDFRYLGQLFGLFLVVERDDRLFLVDQHAAHERILYDRLSQGSAGQELLFPLKFGAEKDYGDVLEQQKGELEKLGIEIRQIGPEIWELVSVPASIGMEAEELIDMIRELAARPEDFSRELYASMACRAAIMDGDIISRATAMSIISDALELTNARCPHGRPIWAEFSREQLMKIVGRI